MSLILYDCVRVCMCVCARVCVCMCVCVRARELTQSGGMKELSAYISFFFFFFFFFSSEAAGCLGESPGVTVATDRMAIYVDWKGNRG